MEIRVKGTLVCPKCGKKAASTPSKTNARGNAVCGKCGSPLQLDAKTREKVVNDIRDKAAAELRKKLSGIRGIKFR